MYCVGGAGMNTEVARLLSEIRAWPWSEVKSVAELVLYYLTVLAVLGCLIRLGAIGRIVGDFLKARGPLWELQTTVGRLGELEPAILSLGTQLRDLELKVDAARKQVTELQADSISTRSDAEDTDSIEGEVKPLFARESGLADEFLPPPEAEDRENRNWLKLREYWRRNRKRIEFVIDGIKDGRTKLSYDRLPRTNYTRILNKLQGQKIISAAAANASRELNTLFNSYRPRSRQIPDEVVESLAILDDQLDQELVPFEKVLAAERSEDLQLEDPLSQAPLLRQFRHGTRLAANSDGHAAAESLADSR